MIVVDNSWLKIRDVVLGLVLGPWLSLRTKLQSLGLALALDLQSVVLSLALCVESLVMALALKVSPWSWP